MQQIILCDKKEEVIEREAMHLLQPNTTSSDKDTADIMITNLENKNTTFPQKFKYLGKYNQKDLKNNFDFKTEIEPAIRTLRIYLKRSNQLKSNHQYGTTKLQHDFDKHNVVGL